MVYRSILIIYMEKNKKIYLIISIVSFVIALIALITIGMLLVSFKKGEEDYNRLAQQARERIRPIAGSIINDEEEIPEETMPDPVDIPIDFEFLKGENQDIVIGAFLSFHESAYRGFWQVLCDPKSGSRADTVDWKLRFVCRFVQRR